MAINFPKMPSQYTKFCKIMGTDLYTNSNGIRCEMYLAVLLETNKSSNRVLVLRAMMIKALTKTYRNTVKIKYAKIVNKMMLIAKLAYDDKVSPKSHFWNMG